MPSLTPKLRRITVDPGTLLLDPNNPRFVTSHEEHVNGTRLADSAVIVATADKMKQERFHVSEITQSILTNGWQPVDAIFVRRYLETDKYLVLEGNRRVAAIQSLLGSERTPIALREALYAIEALEVYGESSPEDYDKKVAYLLGVRHHGALKKWSPLAQARNIFKTYQEFANASGDDDFHWKSNIGEQVAKALSISRSDVQERLTVYRAMSSIAGLPDVGPQKMRDRYYSLMAELCKRLRGALGAYVVQSPDTFLLDARSAERVNQLCHFSDPTRSGSPITNPQEWAPFERIMSDENETKRAANLQRVEVGKEPPSVVWAQRSEELRRLEWSRWLEQVLTVLSQVQLGDIEIEDSKAVAAVARLSEHLGGLHRTQLAG
jgi:hypothetical protein